MTSPLEDPPADSPFGITAIEGNEFTVRFPLVRESESLLKITFRAAVLVYSSSSADALPFPASRAPPRPPSREM